LIGAGDAVMLRDPYANLSAQFGVPITSPPADRLLSEGDLVDYAGIPLEVMEIPGHSPGHIVYWDKAGKRLFGGDVLFAGSVGRTDFPGGSFKQLSDGIRSKVFTLPGDTAVFPGHGPVTTVAEEMQNNAFVGRPTS
jgi:hydroxyacylglutathione hydrolase